MKEKTRKKLVKKLEKQIPDFAKKIAPVYQTLSWEWSSHTIPTKSEIQDTLYFLLKAMKEEKIKYIKSGGLFIRFFKDDYLWIGELGFEKTIEEYIETKKEKQRSEDENSHE